LSRILVWSPNYAPERTGIPPLVTDACEWLARRGHAVEVVTAHPNYPERRIAAGYRRSFRTTERRGAVTVHRSWLRVRPNETFVDKALYELTFTAASAPTVARGLSDSDVLLCVVPCLTAAATSGVLKRVRRRDGRLVVWVQDLVLGAAGSLEGVGAAARWLISGASTLERVAMRSADAVVVCNPVFADHAVERGAARKRVELIYNWVDLDRIRADQPPLTSSATRFLYAGNLGYTQGFETLFAAASLVGDDIAIDIVGAGNSERRVRDLASGSKNIRVHRPVSDEAFPALLAAADAHLVLQRGASADVNFPSKIATYLASGRPIVASISLNSAAASVLADSGGAIVVRPEDPRALAEAMRRLRARPDLRRELGARGRVYAEQNFGRDGALVRFEHTLLGTTPSRPTESANRHETS